MGSCKFCFFVVPILYKMKNTSLIFILTILSFQSKIFIIFLNLAPIILQRRDKEKNNFYFERKCVFPG